MNSIIDVCGVSYIYGAGTPFEVKALDNINVSVRRGSVTGIVGHTGSGKTTLVRLFNGLEKPTSGTILMNGEDIWKKPKEIGKLCFKVGLVMQYPEYQLFEETVSADVSYGPQNMGLNDEEIGKRVRESCQLVGLTEEDLDRSPFELSGGQKRRAAIAGVMAMQPEVLVLDEPAAGLDPEGRKAIFDAIDEYRRKREATVLIVSHSMEDMAERCDDIIVMAGGKIAASGSKDEIFSDPELLISSGLDVPQITRLAALLRERGVQGLDCPIYTIDGAAKVLEELLRRKDAK